MSQTSKNWWDFGRFVKTLSYFGAVPWLSDQSWFQAMMGSRPNPTVDLTHQSSPQTMETANRRVILDFSQPDLNLADVWGPLDDVVMGGVSESGVRIESGVGVFSGYVSTANNGGFASVRSRNFDPPLDLSGFDGIELNVKGDGQRYKFFLRTEAQWDGVAHCYSFDTTPGEWITLQMPFSDFVAVFRAKTVDNASLHLNCMTALQLMLSKFEFDKALNPHFTPGRFELQVQSIAAYRA
ncbi:CIA30 family protein [Leptolyngbya sp. AN02str]|uniref:CIA30 family protein n=1 Tax=Leptolyngbya sp. AN02str TaxID=3423363 RepID=UPI003D31DFDC